jgi:hypothetical protein
LIILLFVTIVDDGLIFSYLFIFIIIVDCKVSRYTNLQYHNLILIKSSRAS